MNRVIYPGSFDPLTNGHINIIRQAADLFDEVVVAVMINPSKKTSMFTIEQRTAIIKEYFVHDANIRVVSAQGAVVDVAINCGCKAIVRGLRGLSDYDYEVQLMQTNKEISDNRINTVCLFADREYQFVSSSMVKEVFALGKDVRKYVPDIVFKAMCKRTAATNENATL